MIKSSLDYIYRTIKMNKSDFEQNKHFVEFCKRHDVNFYEFKKMYRKKINKKEVKGKTLLVGWGSDIVIQDGESSFCCQRNGCFCYYIINKNKEECNIYHGKMTKYYNGLYRRETSYCWMNMELK